MVFHRKYYSIAVVAVHPEQIGTSVNVVACVSHAVGIYEEDVVPDVLRGGVSVYCQDQLLVEVGGI